MNSTPEPLPGLQQTQYPGNMRIFHPADHKELHHLEILGLSILAGHQIDVGLRRRRARISATKGKSVLRRRMARNRLIAAWILLAIGVFYVACGVLMSGELAAGLIVASPFLGFAWFTFHVVSKARRGA